MDLFSLVAKVRMDDSEYISTVQNAKKTAKEYSRDVMRLQAEMRRTGMSQSEAMKAAYAQIDRSLYDLGKSTKKAKKETEYFADATEEGVGKSKKHWWQLSETVENTGTKIKASTVMLGNWMFEVSKSAFRLAADIPKVGIGYNMQMEDYTTNFKVMLGSMEAATAKVDELKTMAAKTPFAMEDLADATQTLLAFGVQSEKTTSVMTRLGDISLGNAQRMSSLSNAYGKAAAQGKLTGEVVQMMVDAGFNPLLQISEATGESMEKLQKRMSAGAVSVDELDLALRRATSEGGQFYRGMEEASKTLSGQLSTLEDNWNAFLGEAMSPVNEQLSSKILPKAIESLDRLSGALFGVENQAGETKKSLFLNTEGQEIDPKQNLLTWYDEMLKVWTDGKKEDDETVAAFVAGFGENTQAIIDALRARINDPANALSEDELTTAQNNMTRLTEIKDQIDAILTAYQGKTIPEDVLASVRMLAEEAGALADYTAGLSNFDTNVVTPWERLVTAAGDASVGAIDKIADFFEWCASENGENGKKVLEGSGIALAAIAGLKVGGFWGGVVGGAFGAAIVFFEDVRDAAMEAFTAVTNLLGLFGMNAGQPINNLDGAKLVANKWSLSQFFKTGNGLGVTGGGGISEATSSGAAGNYVGGRADAGGGVGNMSQSTAQKRAVGLDYVPFDEFPALLHEGEAVLTRMEAQQWRAGNAPNARKAEIDYERLGEAVARAIANSGIGFSVGGRQLAVATAGDNSRAINARQHDINVGKVRF